MPAPLGQGLSSFRGYHRGASVRYSTQSPLRKAALWLLTEGEKHRPSAGRCQLLRGVYGGKPKSCLIEFLDAGQHYLASRDALMLWEYLWKLEAKK